MINNLFIITNTHIIVLSVGIMYRHLQSPFLWNIPLKPIMTTDSTIIWVLVMMKRLLIIPEKDCHTMETIVTIETMEMICKSRLMMKRMTVKKGKGKDKDKDRKL